MSPLGKIVALTKLDILDDIWWHDCFMTLMILITSFKVEVSLLSKKYSIFWNLLLYCIIQIYTL